MERKEYPELHGTMAICEEIIAARSKQAREELHAVRQYKDQHVKAQNYMIATLYKEIERLLQQAK